MGPEISGYPVAFLLLNLLLAPLGALLAGILSRWHAGRSWAALARTERAGSVIVGAAWVVASAHALYPATLVRHLADAPAPRSTWEALAYAVAAVAGFLFFHAALAGMRCVVRELGAPRLARAVPFAAAPIIALGAVLGVVRIDSWDILRAPGRVAGGLVLIVGTAPGLLDWAASAALAACGFALVDLALVLQVPRADRAPSEGRETSLHSPPGR